MSLSILSSSKVAYQLYLCLNFVDNNKSVDLFFNTFVEPLLNNPVRVVRGKECECHSMATHVSKTSRSGSSLTMHDTHSRTVRMEQPLAEGRRARVSIWMPTGAPTSGVEAAHAAPSPGHPTHPSPPPQPPQPPLCPPLWSAFSTTFPYIRVYNVKRYSFLKDIY